MNPAFVPTGRTLVTIVLPAKNEEAAIGPTLRALPLATLRAMGFDAEVFVLDGNSTDRTAEIARQWGAQVVPDQEPGKGAALRHARGLFRGDYVLMLDADGSYAPDAIPRLLSPLARGDADVVMGRRAMQPGSMTASHRVGNLALSVLATCLNGRLCLDVCTGMWGFRREALLALPLRSHGFGIEAELFSIASRLRMRVRHVPVDYLPRVGRAKLKLARDGVRILGRLVLARVSPLPPGPAAPSAAPAAPSPAAAAKPPEAAEVHG